MGLDPQTLAIVEDVMGPLGSFLAIVMFASAFPVMRDICRMRSVGEYSYFPYVVQILNCILWTTYSWADFDGGKMFWPLFANGIGLIITLTSLTIYTIYCAQPAKKAMLLRSVPPLVLCAAYGLFTVVNHTEEVVSIAGTVTMLINTLMTLGPCAGIGHAVRTRSVEFLPLSLGVSSLTCNIPWAFYGLAIANPNVWIPNVIGLFFGSAQVITYIWLTRCMGARPVVHEGSASIPPKIQASMSTGNLFAFIESSSRRGRSASEPSLASFDFESRSTSTDREHASTFC
eukprot:TRINITY_DN48860_c0_g1_i1.p1 TRINITY_DN48860_c0_g1~~TRINITY_DN48860_c0_g1_i1.p1  ORF type:complete len:287 (-),score=-0.33 TRINITY_DN48860_c0_g1_i1:74-934(-)